MERKIPPESWDLAGPSGEADSAAVGIATGGESSPAKAFVQDPLV